MIIYTHGFGVYHTAVFAAYKIIRAQEMQIADEGTQN